MPLRAKFLIAAAACLLAAAVPARATDLAPYVTHTSTGSINVAWMDAGGGNTAVISSSNTFAAAFSTTTQTDSEFMHYSGLDPNTTYYFKVKLTAEGDGNYSQVSTATLAVAPGNIYTTLSYFSSDSSYTAVAGVGWDTNSNPEWTSYELSYYKGGGPETAVFLNNPLGTPISVGGLDANTTYYFKVRARGISGTFTNYAANITTACTMALRLSLLPEGVYETSATLRWNTVSNDTLQAMDSSGYQVRFSITESLDGATVFTTENPEISSNTFAGLARNTTYYYRAGARNWPGTANEGGVRRLTTLSQKPAGAAFTDVAAFSATLNWTALTAADGLGYSLQASTGEFFSAGETLHSSVTYNMAVNSLTLGTLDPNTTYYFRVGTLNKAYAPNYGPSFSSVTLAMAIEANLTATSAQAQSITVWFRSNIESPQAFADEGYILAGSSTNFSGGALYSSATYTYQEGWRPLTLEGLSPNTTYYLKLGSLNWERTPHYTVLPPVKTGFPSPPVNVLLDDNTVWSSSVAVSFTYNTSAIADGHVAEASTDRYFTSAVISSASPSGTISSLQVMNLSPNTRYYFRAGALYNGTTIYTNSEPADKYTLASQVSGLGFAGVFQSSATLSWTSFTDSAKSLRLEVSDSQSFVSVLASSATTAVTRSTLAVTGLSPNTSYYFRVATLNETDHPNYTYSPTTATLANPPRWPVFHLTPFSINLTWDANGNPTDTSYLVQLSSYPDFSHARPSSTTALSSATFSDLLPNTVYYSSVTAINRLGRAIPAVSFSSMATGAYDPAPLPPSGISAYSFSANWGDNNNKTGTYYVAEISSSTDFSGLVLSSRTLSFSATFYGLVSNASYYMRVSALNLTDVPTDPPVALEPPALTWPTTAYILPQAQTFTNMLIDGFTANWSPNENSTHTWYYVQASTDVNFSVVNSSRLVQALSCTFSDLELGTTYWTRVQARGQTGIESAYADVVRSTRTLSHTLRNSLASEDNTISLETSYGTISVLVPAGSIGSSTRLRLEPLYSFSAPASAVGQLTPTGIGISITHSPPTLVLDAITITVPYRLADLPAGIDRSRLILALYDEANSIWVPLPSVSDTASNRVIGQTWHLSTFQIMQSNPGAGLGAVKIYPNPYVPNTVSDVMHFANMPAYAKVKIYTFLGELVRSLNSDINGMVHWDGLNDKGREVASGVYIAFIQTRDKGSSKSFKIALER